MLTFNDRRTSPAKPGVTSTKPPFGASTMPAQRSATSPKTGGFANKGSTLPGVRPNKPVTPGPGSNPFNATPMKNGM